VNDGAAVDGPVALRIEPDPELVSTARLFTAAAARRAGIDEGTIDDLKLAVTEACAAAIEAGAPTIGIDATSDDGSMIVEVTADALGGDTGATDAPIGHLSLVRSLFADAVIDGGNVRLSVPRG
jgi:hypothetical protein